MTFDAMLADMLCKKKATHQYLSHYGLGLSWKGCPESMKKALLGCKATNDYSESSLGGTTQEINKYGCINQHNAAAISDNRCIGLDPELMERRKKGMYIQL